MAVADTEVRRAVNGDEFFPVFQPIVELRTGQLGGFEALARWRHPSLGVLKPDDFIPVIEKAGLIDRLTHIIFSKAFASRELCESPLTLAVNISPTQLLGFDLPGIIAAAARTSGFPLDRLSIEITESALLGDLPHAQAMARELKALHCRLSLDDFGSGYSSLKHLHALPFDVLKVDRSFVSTMTTKRESRKIVAAVVGLGNSLGLTTVAEGVESREQASMLLWLGCDFGQGWLFGRPTAVDEIPRLVAEAQRYPFIALPRSIDDNSIPGLETQPAQRLAQLQAIYDGAPVGLCFLDSRMRYVSLNKRLS